MLDTINKIRRVLPPKYKYAALLLGAGMGACALLELAALALIMPSVSAFADPELLRTNSFLRAAYDFSGAENDRQFIIASCSALVVFYLVKNVCSYLMICAQSSFSLKTSLLVSDRLYRNYMNAPYTFHLEVNSNELLARVNRVNEFTSLFLMPLLMVVSEVTVFLAIIILVTIVSPAAALVCGVLGILALPAFYLPLRRFSVECGKKAHTETENLLKTLSQSFAAVREVKLAHAEDEFATRTDKAQAGRALAIKKVYDVGQIPRFGMEFFAVTIAAALMIFMLSSGVSTGSLTVVAAFFIGAMFRLMPSFSRIQYNLILVKNSSYLFNAVYRDMTDFTLEKHEEDKFKARFNKELCIKDLCYRYPGAANDALHNFSLVLKPRECLAIAGRTGCGKSTLVNIITGFLKPDSGSVTSDGGNIFDSLDSWRGKISYVTQTPVIFDDTIQANVAFGVPACEIDKAKVTKALADAQILDFVNSLENGLMTNAGESGSHLSGGQKQRIAIARALYRTPELLILDEATSALDPETETAVMDTMKKLKGSLAIIMITHRTSTLEYADRTIIMEQPENNHQERQ